jgi:hypothetical protein
MKLDHAELTAIGIYIYIISFIGMRRFIRIAHSPNGIWEDFEPTLGDIVLTIVPFWNTIMLIYGTIVHGFNPIKTVPRKPINIKKFFGL